MNRKTIVAILVLSCLPILLTGCGDKNKKQVLSEKVRGDLANQVSDSSDPKFILYVMDAELDAVEAEESASGSFTDYFVPMMSQALKAGAARGEVAERLERLIDLGEDEKYFSSWVQAVMEKNGADAIRSYAWDWIGAGE